MATASGIRAGRAFIELSLSDSKFVKGLQSAERRMQAMGKSIALAGTKVAAFGTAGVLGFVPAIKAASDFQETFSKFQTVFGDQSDAMKAFADDLAEHLGRSQTQIVQFLAASQDLFVPLGFDEATATNLSKTITSLAVDLASFNNIADDDALRDLQAALTGSGEVMKKYGVIVSEAAVKQKLLDQGLDPKNATEQQKVMARLGIILAGTTAAQGDAVRTSGSFANQMKRLKGQLMDVAVALGDAILPSLTKIVSSINSAGKAVIAWVKANKDWISTAFAVAAGVAAIGGAMIVLGGVISGIGSVIGVVVTAFTAVGTAIGAILPIVTALLSPLGLVVAAIAALGVAAVKWFGGFGAVIDAVKGQVSGLSDTFGGAVEVIKTALAGGDIATAGRVLWASLKLIWAKGVATLNQTWAEWKNFFIGIWIDTVSFIATSWVTVVSGVQDVWTRAWGFIQDAFDLVKTALLNGFLIIGEAVLAVVGKIQEAFDYVFGTNFAENINAAKKRLGELREEANKQFIERVGKRDQDRRDRLQQLERDKNQTLAILEEERQRQQAGLGQGQTKAVEDAQRQLDEAFAAYQKTVDDAAAKQADAAKQIPTEVGDKLDDVVAGIGETSARTPTRATQAIFGGERAGQIFGNVQNEQLNVMKKTQQIAASQLEETKKTRQSLTQGLVFS